MKIALLILSLMFLLLIAWNDIRRRSISLLLFILEACTAFPMMVLLNLPGYWKTILLTFLIAGIQITLIWVWFRFIHRADSFFDTMFGWGDLVMIAIVILHFSPVSFILFMIVSSFAGLMWYFLWKLINSSASQTVPLAGVMALLLVPVQIADNLGRITFYFNGYSF